MPLWTYPRRSSSRATVSPLAVKRKWPWLNNAGVHRTDGYLMQSLAVHGLKCIVGRIPKQRRFPRTERRAQPPRAVIEPRSFIGRTSRGVAIEIHDCAFEPDRGRMIFAD